MSEAGKAAAKKFLSTLTPLFGEADKPAFEKVLEHQEFLDKLGDGVLAQDEFSRKMGEASQVKAAGESHRVALQTWLNEVMGEFKAAGFLGDDRASILAAVKAKLASLASGASGGEGDGMLSKEEVAALVAAEVAKLPKPVAGATPEAVEQAMLLASYLPGLAVTHFQKYGKVLDTQGLLAHARKTGRAIDAGGYEDFVKDEITAAEKAAHDKEILEAEARGAAKARGELSGAPPWPTSDSPMVDGQVSTLSGLTLRKKAEGEGAVSHSDAASKAADEYNRLIQERQSRSTA